MIISLSINWLQNNNTKHLACYCNISQHFCKPQICQNRSTFSNIVFPRLTSTFFVVMTDYVLLLNAKQYYAVNLHAHKEFEYFFPNNFKKRRRKVISQCFKTTLTLFSY